MNAFIVTCLQRSLCILVVAFIGTANADVYRYQDEKGRWHFTDTPPSHIKNVDIISQNDESDNSEVAGATSESVDLQENLFKRFNPKSPIEQATLSVVTIESRMSSGSGFFVTNDCHIVTNRHVLRPSETGSWEEQKEKLDEEEKNLAELKIDLKAEKERLDRYQRTLQKHKLYLEGMVNGNERRQEKIEYDQYLEIYKKDAASLENDHKSFEKKENEFKKRKSEFSLDSSLAKVSRTFDVILKDDSKRKAHLVHLSEDLDLALIKIDQCQSPFLELDLEYQAAQGHRVYSIGSPLGQRDHLTSGVITNVKEDAITIDAQILPGNSGGPLINEKGKIIGVNTLKLSSDNPNSQGFGIAIPGKIVKEGLWGYLNH